MDLWQLIALGAGIALILGTLLDLFLTVLHHDSIGWLVPRIEAVTWRCAVLVSRALPRLRRPVLALAGPTMIAATLATWFLGFVIGFSFLFWTALDGFRAESELGPLTYLDALYYSGGTGSVLGFGDITPLEAALQVASFVQASLGFVLITASVTYLLGIVGTAGARNALAIRVQIETGESGEGIGAVERWVRGEESPDDIIRRLGILATGVSELEERLHQSPILALHYRVNDPRYDTEQLIAACSAIAVGRRLLSGEERYGRIRLATEDLEIALSRLMQLIAERHLPHAIRESLAVPHASQEDREEVARLTRRLPGVRSVRAPEGALRLAARTRVFLDALDSITQWRRDR